MKIIRHLQEVVAPDTFTPLAVYDGRKNMFATRDLPLGPSGSASVPVDTDCISISDPVYPFHSTLSHLDNQIRTHVGLLKFMMSR
jgi:hypothetical protein